MRLKPKLSNDETDILTCYPSEIISLDPLIPLVVNPNRLSEQNNGAVCLICSSLLVVGLVHWEDFFELD